MTHHCDTDRRALTGSVRGVPIGADFSGGVELEQTRVRRRRCGSEPSRRVRIRLISVDMANDIAEFLALARALQLDDAEWIHHPVVGDINPADGGWANPALQPPARWRQHPPGVG